VPCPPRQAYKPDYPTGTMVKIFIEEEEEEEIRLNK
jgi:hypothetical protein